MECVQCGDSFLEKERKRFCSKKCRTRFNSAKRYNRLKDNVDFKEERKKVMREWYKENKVRHNIKMRIYMRKYYRDNYSNYAKRKKEGRENEAKDI